MKKGIFIAMFAALAMCFTVACTDDDTTTGGSGNGNGNGNGSGQVDANFPAGTNWAYTFDTTMTENYEGYEMSMNMTLTIGLNFAATGNTADLTESATVTAMGQTMPMGEETTPLNYTYNSSTATGKLFATGVDPETGEEYEDYLPFTYNASDNTIVIDVPEEFFQDDEDDDDDDDDDDYNFDYPTHWVFHRVN